MTVQDAIDRVDVLAPNQYDAAQKMRWLSDLDGRIYREVIVTHHGNFYGTDVPDGGYTDGGEELLVKEPYASDLYENYLLSRIADRNAEVTKYNQFATLFNEAYLSFCNRYNRTHMPRSAGGWRF